MRTRYGFCEPCEKRRYATQVAAEEDLARFQAMPRSEKTPVRAYQCHLGWWHLTSQEAPRWEQQAG